jgi:hypothetical protein
MSEQDKQATKNLAARAAREARAAASDATVVVENGASHAAEETVDTVRRFNPRGLAGLSGDTGTGFLALSVALYAGTIAFNKFRSVYAGRGRALSE